VDFNTLRESLNLRVLIFRRLIEQVNPETVLDLGCGDGRRYAFAFFNREIIGVDLDLEALKRYPGGRIFADIRLLPLRQEEIVDAVVCSEVLEHLDYSDAIRVLDGLEGYAKKLVIVTTPTYFQPHGRPEEPLTLHRCVIRPSKLKRRRYKIRGLTVKLPTGVLRVLLIGLAYFFVPLSKHYIAWKLK